MFNPTDAPDNPAVKLLNKLMVKAERASPSGRTQGVKPIWNNSAEAQMIGYKILEHAAQLGAIRLTRPKGQEHVIAKVTLADGDALAAFLGHTRAQTKAVSVLDHLEPYLQNAPFWLHDEIEIALQRWSRGDNAFRFAPTETDKIINLVKLIIAIDAGVDGIDRRTFNARAGVPTKTLEENLGTVIDIMRRAYGYTGLSNDEVMAELGFRPFDHPVHIQGPVRLASGQECSTIKPYVALPPAAIEGVSLSQPIKAILTIENFASFNRHVEEQYHPEVVTVYSAGFASRPVIDTLRQLHAAAGNVPHFHRGDIDAGGVRIFRNLEERLDRLIHPHLMDIDTAHRLGVPKPANPKLSRLASKDSGVAYLAAYLAGPNPHHLEQEGIDPSPVSVAT